MEGRPRFPSPGDNSETWTPGLMGHWAESKLIQTDRAHSRGAIKADEPSCIHITHRILGPGLAVAN